VLWLFFNRSILYLFGLGFFLLRSFSNFFLGGAVMGGFLFRLFSDFLHGFDFLKFSAPNKGQSISRIHGHDFNSPRGHSNSSCTKKYADGRQKRKNKKR
jgi:hypothetical protein